MHQPYLDSTMHYFAVTLSPPFMSMHPENSTVAAVAAATASSSSPSRPSPSSQLLKDGEKTIPFLRQLTEMLLENRELISFVPGSKGTNQSVPGKIIIHDRNRVQSEVLPTYFNHASFASLRRQLSYFSFVRVGKGRQGGVTYTNESVYEMSDILKLKRRTTGGAASVPSITAATRAAGNNQQNTTSKQDVKDQKEEIHQHHQDQEQVQETTQDVASAVNNGIFHAAKTNRDVVQSQGMSCPPINGNNKTMVDNKTPSCTSLSPSSACRTATTTETAQTSTAPSGGFRGNDGGISRGKNSGDIPRDILQNSINVLGNNDFKHRTSKKTSGTKKNNGNATTTKSTNATTSTNTTMTTESSSSSRQSQKISSRKRTKHSTNSSRNKNLRLDRLMHVNNNIVPFIHLPAKKLHKPQSLTDLIVEVNQTSDPTGSDIMHHQQHQEESQPMMKKARNEEPLAFAASATPSALPVKVFHQGVMEHPYLYPAQDHAQEVNKVSPAIHALLSLGEVKHNHEFGPGLGFAAAVAGGASNIGISTFL
mmetsp:Transcript_11944/g.24479  ORF Transcript_11944/g.24479 Transcript_11944/m.24479 type:complete len:537 (+) Transcript_11944:117-1727(+)